MFYIAMFIFLATPYIFAIYCFRKARDYKIRLEQICFSYNAMTQKLNEGETYENATEKMLDDLVVTINS